MLIRLPDISTQKMRFMNVSEVRTFYANGTTGQSDWAVIMDLGSTYGTPQMVSGLTQSDAEAFCHDIALALGIDWEQ